MLISTAAEYMDCSPDQVEQIIRDGHLGALQFNERGDRRILKEEIDTFLRWRREVPVVSRRRVA